MRYPKETEKEKQLRLEEIKLLNDIIDNVTKALESSGASQFGIDGNDMRVLIKSLAGVKIDFLNEETWHDQYMYAKERFDPDNKKSNEEINRLAAESYAEDLLRYFSACIALQQHNEKAFIDMMTDFKKEPLKNAQQTLAVLEEDEPGLNERGKEDISTMAMMAILEDLVLLDIHARRKSPIAELESEILIGKDSKSSKANSVMAEVSKTLAMIYDLDLSKHADCEQLSRIEATMLKRASQAAGLPLPAAPMIG